MKVYLVVFEWSTEESFDVDIEAYNSYNKAVTRFKQRIEEEKTDMSWACDAFDENGDIVEGYELEECPPNEELESYAFWKLKSFYGNDTHDFISIVPLEIQ